LLELSSNQKEHSQYLLVHKGIILEFLADFFCNSPNLSYRTDKLNLTNKKTAGPTSSIKPTAVLQDIA